MTTLTVMPASASDLNALDFERWLANTEPEWFLEYLSPSPEARARHLRGRFAGALAWPAGRAFLCSEGERMLGAMALERLAWDSAHFGFECGRVAACCVTPGLNAERRRALHAELVQEALRWADEQKIRLLQRRLLSSRTDEIRCLEDAGFRLADNMVTLLASLVSTVPARKPVPRLDCRAVRSSDLPSLLVMTRGAFPHSRFVQDPVLNASRGDEVYQRWIENLLLDQHSDNTPEGTKAEVMVAAVGGTVAGYATYRMDRALDERLGRRLGMLDLIVVDPAFRGQGIGRALLHQAMDQMRKDGVGDIEATTWINQREAMALYQGAGFLVKENLLTWHWWRS
jgi:GNAT superfamily N-acetyltransferase